MPQLQPASSFKDHDWIGILSHIYALNGGYVCAALAEICVHAFEVT